MNNDAPRAPGQTSMELINASQKALAEVSKPWQGHTLADESSRVEAVEMDAHDPMRALAMAICAVAQAANSIAVTMVEQLSVSMQQVEVMANQLELHLQESKRQAAMMRSVMEQQGRKGAGGLVVPR